MAAKPPSAREKAPKPSKTHLIETKMMGVPSSTER